MIKRRLQALKKADENKILKEHENLYQRLVSENYSESQVKVSRSSAREKPQKPNFMRWAVPALSCALALVVAVVALWPGAKKNDQSPAVSEVIVENVSISTVENSLEKSRIATDDLNFKSISASQTGEQENYFELKVDSFNTFEMIVQVNPEFEISSPAVITGSESASVNGFDVNYTVNKRRQEDYFLFKTNAVVDTGKEIYYITYNYSSVNAECELLDIINMFIQPK